MLPSHGKNEELAEGILAWTYCSSLTIALIFFQNNNEKEPHGYNHMAPKVLSDCDYVLPGHPLQHAHAECAAQAE
jgi:hypothetical protein